MKTKVFPLTNVVLYAKGWYKTSDNIFEDLKEILNLDGYTPFTNNDVFSILINNFQNFDIQASQLRETLIGIHPQECWKINYRIKGGLDIYDEESLPEYDMVTATIYYILSTLRFIDTERWNPKVPQYKKYPKNPSITLNTVIRHFNKPKTIKL